MYPYSSSSSPDLTEDEPTMTDLRGVLPGQRPPMDPTVLEEPTSEVPVIRPAAGTEETDAEAEEAEAEEAEAEEAEAEEAEAEEAEAEEAEAGAVAEAATDTVTEAEPVAEPESESESDVESEVGAWTVQLAEPAAEVDSDAAVETEPIAESEEQMEMSTTGQPPVAGNGADLTPPVSPLITPPVVGFGSSPTAETVEVEPEPDPDSSEMAKLAWNPTTPLTGAPTAPGTPPAPADTVSTPRGLAEMPIALWSDADVARLHDQWRDLQVQFFDDPATAMAGAKDLVTETVQELANTLQAAHDQLDPYREGEPVDTETMRLAMRRYREFLDRVLAL